MISHAPEPRAGLAALLLPAPPPGPSDIVQRWCPPQCTSPLSKVAEAASRVFVARADAAALAPARGIGNCPVLRANSPYSLKQYPEVHLPSTWSLLGPQQLAWLYVKNAGVVLLLQTNMWLYQALEAEEHALQHGTQAQLPPYPGLLQQLGRATWAAWRELLTRLTRSELKHWINHSASSRAAWKLLKDPRDSITRKALFYSAAPPLQRLPMYTTTVLRTQLPTYAAELIVACAYDAVAELQQLVVLPAGARQPLAAPLGGSGGGGVLAALQRQRERVGACLQPLLNGRARVEWGQLRAASRRLGSKAARHALRLGGTAVCAALGAAVAGAVAPQGSAGTWAFRGLIVTDLIVANGFLLLLDGPLGDALAPASEDKGTSSIFAC